MECVIEECPTATLRARAPGVTTCSIPHVTAQTRVRERASERALLCGICIVHCPCEEYRYDCSWDSAEGCQVGKRGPVALFIQ